MTALLPLIAIVALTFFLTSRVRPEHLPQVLHFVVVLYLAWLLSSSGGTPAELIDLLHVAGQPPSNAG